MSEPVGVGLPRLFPSDVDELAEFYESVKKCSLEESVSVDTLVGRILGPTEGD